MREQRWLGGSKLWAVKPACEPWLVKEAAIPLSVRGAGVAAAEPVGG